MITTGELSKIIIWEILKQKVLNKLEMGRIKMPIVQKLKIEDCGVFDDLIASI